MELILVVVIALVGLSIILQLTTLVKITQIQNGQKHKPHNQNPVHNHGKKHGNQNQNQNKNKNPQQDNRVNQNNNRPAQQQQANPNQNKQQQPSAPEKKFDKIVSNAQPLKETNAQLANRPKPQQQGGNNNGKPKVYSERTAPAQNQGVQKQERPANAPIKQQELPKSEADREEQPQQPKTEAPKATPQVEEARNDDASVSYGRR
ncbi:MAG: hypothetical protein FWE23_02470 [Chitinivibrionia bacterium]|nr:hypothetical protein [Chitinivibrionia bacterium]